MAPENPASARPAQQPEFFPHPQQPAAAEILPPSRGFVAPVDQPHYFGATSDQPFKSAHFETLTEDEQAKLIGTIILNRHQAAGRLNSLSYIARNLILGMANFYGEKHKNCGGLFVPKTRLELSQLMGVPHKSTYVPMRELIESKMISPIKFGGPKGDVFELLMPPLTASELIQKATPETGRKGGNCDEDLQGLARAPREATPVDRRKEEELARAGREATPVDGRISCLASLPARASPNDTTSCIELNCNAMQLGEAQSGGEGGEEESAKVDLLISGGFDPDQPGLAITLSKHPDCTIERIKEAMRRCDETERAGKLRGSRAGFITHFIKNKWLPRSDGGEKKRELETKHRRRTERAVEAEAENQKSIREVIAERDAPPPPSAPKTELAIEREKIEILSALPAEEIAAMVEKIIAAEPEGFIKKAYELSRQTPFKMATLVYKLFAMHSDPAAVEAAPFDPAQGRGGAL